MPMPPALLVTLLVFGLAFLVAFASRTVRRFLFTVALLTRAVVLSLGARLIGRRGAGPARLREAFEALGPTYVKLAQLVASSEGMFPEPYCVEFRRCLDRVPSFSLEEVERTVREELGRDPKEIFATLEGEPLASASIAQVHCATLKDGADVVVKVQRPGLERTVAADLRVLRALAFCFERLPRGESANPRGIVDDFAQNLAEELDFRREASNLDEFNEIVRKHSLDGVAAPTPYHEWSSPRVLVMERFHGARIDDLERLAPIADQLEGKLLLGMRAWFRSLLVHGFFHGDVHAGNLMALDDGRIGFLDFGIVGRFDGERRLLSSQFLMAIAGRDFVGLARCMMEMGNVTDVDPEALGADLEIGCAPLLDPTRPAKYADLLPIITRATLRHRMSVPRDFVLILKQMVYFDRYAKLLAPNLNIFSDPRIVAALMEDIVLAQSAAAA